MASHQIAIAKATFAATLLRPDPKPVSRDHIAQFHSLLNAVSTECSPTNIQTCKRWILSNVIQSSARITALGKYLVALSASFSDTERHAIVSSKSDASSKRKRLHLLYLVNDLIHHTKVHDANPSVGSNLQPVLAGLFSSAASFKDSPKHLQKIEKLLEIWEERHYYPADDINRLREAVEIAQRSDTSVLDSDSKIVSTDAAKSSKEIPFTMPAMHGDQNLPWYDLPAANLMQHIVPNSTRPINPSLVKPLQFVAGPADEELVNAVKSLFQEVDCIYGAVASDDERSYSTWDINELGQRILQDEISGKALGDEGYYGWSKAFCEKMKRRYKGLESTGPVGTETSGRLGRGFSRSPSRSRSSSRSSHPVKRRRYSSSNDSRSRSRSRARSRSRSRSRDQSRSGSRSRMAHPPVPPQTEAGIPHLPNYPLQPQPPHQGRWPPPPPPIPNYAEQNQQYKEWQQYPLPPQFPPIPPQWQPQMAHGYQAGFGGWHPQQPNSHQQPDKNAECQYNNSNTYPGQRGY